MRLRTHKFFTTVVYGVVVTIVALIAFLFLPAQPIVEALIIVAIVFPLSLFALVAARAWTTTRVRNVDPAGPGTPDPGGPPFDMLRPGEKLLLHFKSERTPEPQLLIATNQRFVRASVLGLDRTFILDEAGTGQLSGITSQRVGHDLMTTAHFHNRQDMHVVGGDPMQSRAFAEAVGRLVRTTQRRTRPSRIKQMRTRAFRATQIHL